MSNWKNTESWNFGQEVEVNFSELLEIRGIKYRKATREEQFKHIDYITSFGTIDVKARKKINRSDNSHQEEFVWLEFKNVRGNKGWLCGDTDIISFEREKDFILMFRIDLLRWAQGRCDLNQLVSNSRDALYKGYTRKGRKDLISIVKIVDILEIPHKIWEKAKQQ